MVYLRSTVAHIYIVLGINHLRPSQMLSFSQSVKWDFKLHVGKGCNDPAHPHRLSSPAMGRNVHSSFRSYPQPPWIHVGDHGLPLKCQQQWHLKLA